MTKSGVRLREAAEFCTKNKLAVIRHPFPLAARVELVRQITSQERRSLLVVGEKMKHRWHGYRFSHKDWERRGEFRSRHYVWMEEAFAYFLAGPGLPLVVAHDDLKHHVDVLEGAEFDMVVVDKGRRLTGRSHGVDLLNQIRAHRRILFSKRPLMLGLTGYRGYRFLSNKIFWGRRGFDRDFCEADVWAKGHKKLRGYAPDRMQALCDRVNPYTWPPLTPKDVLKEDLSWRKYLESL